ncbi:MAG TPA: spermine synthase [Anaerolineae bacterium]|nr:spermine synthase [Anaerolineae bacterium]
MNRSVLSCIQVRLLIQAKREHRSRATTSLDLGLTTGEARLHADRVELSDGQTLTWETLEKIAADEVGCFVIEHGRAQKIQVYSEEFDRVYSLMPTQRAPTLLISGLPMHRIKDIDPVEDTRRKVRAVAPLTGRILDTATGLGYTAIEAARTAAQVVTIEIDPAAQWVARLNPWSQALFDNPKIQPIIGDAFAEAPHLEAGAFSRILHDPPTFSLAGELYSEEMYRRLFRVLRRGGRMFHYIGNLDSSSGQRVLKGVVRRLQAAGFTRITRKPEAFGLVAHKE